MSARQRERLATESAEEREARLYDLNARQCERLFIESSEETAARLRQMSIRRCERLQEQRDRVPSAQLVRQPSIQAKIRTFHAHFATLSCPRCSTCSESFPGLQLRPPSTECMRCSKDMHSPKLYSSANNMDPGPLLDV